MLSRSGNIAFISKMPVHVFWEDKRWWNLAFKCAKKYTCVWIATPVKWKNINLLFIGWCISSSFGGGSAEEAWKMHEIVTVEIADDKVKFELTFCAYDFHQDWFFSIPFWKRLTAANFFYFSKGGKLIISSPEIKASLKWVLSVKKVHNWVFFSCNLCKSRFHSVSIPQKSFLSTIIFKLLLERNRNQRNSNLQTKEYFLIDLKYCFP